MEEVYLDIQRYEGYYQISNFGNVRSMDRVVVYSNGRKAVHKGKIRKPSLSEYRIIALSKNGVVSAFKISRLVAKHFLDGPDDCAVVNHIDGNKHNDLFSNLEWCSYSENSLHAFEKKLSKKKNKVSGVFFEDRRGLWASYLYRNNKNIFCGRYQTEQEAIEAREEKINDKT